MNTVVRLAAKQRCRDCQQASRCLAPELDGTELAQFESAIRSGRIVKRGDSLFRQGDGCQALHLVRSGAVKLTVVSAEGEEQIIRFCLAGDLLGLDVDGSKVQRYSAVALSTVSVCELPVHSTLGQHERYQELALTHFLRHEIAQSHDLISVLGRKSAEQRLAIFLLDLSNRLAARTYSALDFNLAMSRGDIAAYLGLALETVSRLFARLQAESVISVERRNIKILNLARLQQIAGVATEQNLAISSR